MLVLCFHWVEPDPLSDPRWRGWTISPSGLRRAIQSIRATGLEIVSLRDVLAVPRAHWTSAHSSKVILTFDDGYENFLTHAWPVLEKEKCPATVFVLAGLFSGTNDWDQADLPVSKRSRLLSVEQILQLRRSPLVSFASHGMKHRRFPTLTTEELGWELHESHRILSELLGQSYAPVLAYPFGNYDARVLEEMKAPPYEYAFTIKRGRWAEETRAFEVPRHCAAHPDGNPLVMIPKLFYNRVKYSSLVCRPKT